MNDVKPMQPATLRRLVEAPDDRKAESEQSVNEACWRGMKFAANLLASDPESYQAAIRATFRQAFLRGLGLDLPL